MPSLREKIAQLFLVGIGALELSGEERRAIDEYGFGGFILFGRNCCDAPQIVSLTQTLWNAAGGPPPFIAIDQEGGRVHRLPEPFTHFPAAAEIGATGNAGFAYRAGRATAEELALVGINLDFAPVLDVNSNPKNPVIGDRSFAANPQTVAAFGAQWISGLRDGGIIPCGKHFPGHGDTDKDSHFDLPVVNRSLDELREVELAPFVAACRSGIESLMTAHVVYSALDTKLPATLSHKIVTELLREELDYQGVVFTDDLEMKAISDHYGEKEAAALCVRAGVDVMLFGHDLSGAIRAFDSLYGECEKNAAVRGQVEASYRRIVRMKRAFLKRFTGGQAGRLEQQLARLSHQRIVEEIHGSL
jgi:beta-N-acetylhexosaminidase